MVPHGYTYTVYTVYTYTVRMVYMWFIWYVCLRRCGERERETKHSLGHIVSTQSSLAIHTVLTWS